MNPHRVPNHAEMLDRLMHEMRHLNAIIRTNAEFLQKCTSGEKIDIGSVKHYSESIFETSYIVSLWLDIIDLETNPSALEEQEWAKRSIYGKYSKASRAFKRLWKSKEITHSVTGNSTRLIQALPCIDILPYVLIDNASKYSPRNGNIEAAFFESEYGLQISITSLGPVVDSNELERIFEDGYRGNSAIHMAAEGHGKGLAIAKHICELHDASISAHTSGAKFRINEIEYQTFTIKMNFPCLATLIP